MSTQLTPSEVKELRHLLEERFAYFAMALLGPDWFSLPLHKNLCDYLQAPEPIRLVILPRGFLKTTIGGCLYPLWCALRNPNERMLLVSNTMTNASKSIRVIRSYVEESQLISLLWPELIPEFNSRKRKWSDEAASLNRPHEFGEATWEAAGVGTNIVKRHFNRIFEDDTVAPTADNMNQAEIMPTADDIAKAVGFHTLIPPLFVLGETNQNVILNTRWSPNDHIQHIMDRHKVEPFNVPAIVDGKSTFHRVTLEQLALIEQSVGPYLYKALYLNDPESMKDQTFKEEWATYYDPKELRSFEGYKRTVVTVDPADPPTGKSDQCYSAIVGCTHTSQGTFVLGYDKGRWSGYELCDRIINYALEIKANLVDPELDRYPHIIEMLRDRMRKKKCAGRFAVEGHKASQSRKSKDVRIMELQAPMHAGTLLFPESMRHTFVPYICKFKPGFNELDLLDCLAMQIRHRLPIREEEVLPKKVGGRPKIYFKEMLESITQAQRCRGFQRVGFGRN